MRPDPKTLRPAIRRVNYHYRRGTMSDAGGVPTVLAAAEWALDVLEGIDYEAAAEAGADRIMEGYTLFRSPDYGGSPLEHWEIVEHLKWAMPQIVDAAVPGITQGGEKT